nr:hypothetical protein [Tanacetum cinerariifolium]
IKIHDNAGQAGQEKASDHEYILLSFMPSSTQNSNDKDVDEVAGKRDEGVSKGSEIDDQERSNSGTQDVNTVGLSINTANINTNTGSMNINIVGSTDPSMPTLEESSIFNDVYDDREVGAETDTNNLELLTVDYSEDSKHSKEPNKALMKDTEAEDVDVHLYRLMIRSLMYLTASRPNIMFVVCARAKFQVTPKTSHLHAMKIIFRYLKGQSKLSLWYPRDSPLDLEAFSDSDYTRASLERKSTTEGCQFFGKKLISWQYKKQSIVVNSTTKAEYVAAASCCGQLL